MTTASTVKERPILFSAPMVRAILDGRKTMTRRVVKLKPHDGKCSLDCSGIEPERAWADPGLGGGGYLHVPCKDGAAQRVRCPYGYIGERLWVREKMELDEEGWVYAAGGDPVKSNDEAAIDWMASRPAKQSHCVSIHMPRWASRITLEITDVRVERLHEITEADAAAEGFAATHPVHGYGLLPVDAFMHLWHKINGPDSWAANPWVWVVSFKRV